MKQLPAWVLTNPLPAVHDLESHTSVEMVARLYAAMQSLIKEVNEHIAQVNKTVGENDTELKTTLEEFEHKFTRISNDLVRMVREYEKTMDGKINAAVAEAVSTGKIVEVYDPLTESLDFKWEVNGNG
jgi:SMC interacting uncharacterized protein involved in chromosome segregation